MDILSILFPLTLLFTAAAMVVLRAGASRVFFDVVGTFQANRLIADVDAKIGVVNSIILDGLAGIGESVTLIQTKCNNWLNQQSLSQEKFQKQDLTWFCSW